MAMAGRRTEPNPGTICGASRTRYGVPGSELTTFGLGGVVSTLVEVDSIGELSATIRGIEAGCCNSEASSSSVVLNSKPRWRLLGAGSNLIISDSGVSEPVLKLGRGFFSGIYLGQDCSEIKDLEGVDFSPIGRAGGDLTMAAASGVEMSSLEILDRARLLPEELSVIALGGCSLMSLSRHFSQLGYSGLEFGAGIPALLGGAVFMNAGAHGHSISETVRRVWLVERSGAVALLSRDEIRFGYRSSGITGVVVAAELSLVRRNPADVMAERTRCLEYRKRTQPLTFPSAGSLFRNPSEQDTEKLQVVLQGKRVTTAAELLELCGLKGVRRGGVGFSEQHANWLVRLDSAARSADAVTLIEEGRRRVFERFGVSLFPEVVIW